MKTKQKAVIFVILLAVIALSFFAYRYSSGGSLSIISSAGGCSVEPLNMDGHQLQSYDEFRQITGSSATDAQILGAGYVSCSGGLCGTVCTEALS